MSIRTFLIEECEFVQFEIIRVTPGRPCPMAGQYTTPCAARRTAFEGNVTDPRVSQLRGTAHATKALWPDCCDRCGLKFDDNTSISTGEHPLYANADRSWIGRLADAPPGAMWWATWLDDFGHHQLEHALEVKTPGGDWCPDQRASNCTMPQDDEHHCWVLHGPLETVTVDKNGNTCAAGSGSIGQPGYHGFLQNGYLVPA